MTAAEEKGRAQERADVDLGVEIIARMEKDKKALKKITDRLKKRALAGTQEALKDAGREGTRYLAKGTDVEIPIVVTADTIAQSFAENSPAHARAEAAAQGKLADFYKRKVTWEATTKDGKKFRIEAGSILGDDAPGFIAACRALDKFGIPKNGIKILWNGEEEPEEEEGEE